MLRILSRVLPQKIIIGDKADRSICILSVDGMIPLGLVAAKGIADNSDRALGVNPRRANEKRL